MKYKVILADDEEEALFGIQRNLDWEGYGFEVVGTFGNGRDVMEFLETQEADIVITDIRMPFMDGIELAKNIYDSYPQTKVIIISGYGDFQYAKEAMSYRVMDYILKPVNAREMGEALQKVYETLEQEIGERKNIEFLKKQYLENLPVIRENFLNRLVEGDIKKRNLHEELKNCGIRAAEASFWMVALIQVDKIDQQPKEDGMDMQYASVYVRSLILDRLGERCRYDVFYSRMGECILFGMKDAQEVGKILSRLNSIAGESKKAAGICLAMGVGKRKMSLFEIKASFEEAQEALMYRKMTKDSEVICMEDIDISNEELVLFDETSRDLLFSVIKFGDAKDIRSVLFDMRTKLEGQNMSMNACQAWLISVWNAILLFEKQYSHLWDAKGSEGTFDGLKFLGQYENTEAFFQWMEERCLLLGAYFTKERSSKNQNIIEVAQKYIEKEFKNPEISLEMTAEYIGLTPAYFSRLFKKETGETFIKYLTRIRLEEAIRMLDETEEKIYAIAEKTGYLDVGYFSHVFKKKYGISPIQRRRQNR